MSRSLPMLRRIYRWFTRPAGEPIRRDHPTLGTMTYFDGWWEGEVDWNGRPLDWSCDGDETGPPHDVEDLLVRRLAALEELERATRDFLRRRAGAQATIDVSEFRLTGLSQYANDEAQDRFIVWLELPGDRNGLWRVSFVDGQPRELGRDS